MQETPFISLAEFATDDRIYRLIARERGKFAVKSGGSRKQKKGKKQNLESFDGNKLYDRLKELTPKHKLWSNPGRGKLPDDKGDVVAKWTLPKRKAAARVYRAIINHKDSMPDAPWVMELGKFCVSIRDILSGKEPLTLETPTVIAKYKEKEKDSGDHIFRPVCIYSDLESKIIISLAYQYILAIFDKYFHRNMLFMRAARKEGDNKYTIPKFLDAIDMVSAYRNRCDRKPIYVGECDIQKFYDIFNHDVIVDCFEDLFEEAKQKDGAADSDFDPLRRVIRAYLDSFNYPEHVMGNNGDPVFWEQYKRRLKSKNDPDPVCRFKWVKEDAFVSSGCYTSEEFQSVKESGKLGIPQGGALSGIIVNVVMRMVDKPIVTPRDPDRLFIRYCDDILLMHTDKKRCEEYLETYYRQLVNCKLVPHPRTDVSDCKSGKSGKKTGASFWKAKTKNVYLWGSGAGSASDWVAFVGYEMRRTGEIRIRKDKIRAEFTRIARKYYSIIKSKSVTREEPLTEEQREEIMERMDSLAGRILDYEKAGNNIYTRSQAHRLDKYLLRKSRQIAGRIQIPDKKKAAHERTTYLQKLKEKA